MEERTTTEEKEIYLLKDEKENSYFKISLSLQNGGTNYFTGYGENKGYYILFKVVEKGLNYERFLIFDKSSFKICVLPCDRFSKSKEKRVLKFMNENKDILFNYFKESKTESLLKFIKDNFN